MDKIHNGVLRKFHTLCSRLGLTEAEKRAIVESFGVESSADIDTHALIDVCASLSKQLEGDKGDQMDKLRKRAMAAIGGYLRKIDKESNAEIIKGIACRSTGYQFSTKYPPSVCGTCTIHSATNKRTWMRRSVSQWSSWLKATRRGKPPRRY